MQSFGTHVPVLLNEAVDALAIQPGGNYLDVTYGRGGHAGKIIQQLGPRGFLFALDKDPDAVRQARLKFDKEPRFKIAHSDFADAAQVLSNESMLGQFDGILADLGVSSPQLDSPQRGFSFSKDGPLDMRMDSESGASAADWISVATVDEMVRVFREFGEERYAPRIARAIVAFRDTKTIVSTTQLANIVKQAHPKWERGKHPATRVFQAIRIHVNGELDALKSLLRDSSRLLKTKGRLVIISFHSIEDRMVKRFMRAGFQANQQPRNLPSTIAQQHPFRVISKPITPMLEETSFNPRARSSVLRVAEKWL